MKKRKKEEAQRQGGMTRRGFLTTTGAGAVGAAASGALLAQQRPAEAQEAMAAGELHKITLMVNGRPCTLLVEPRWSLLFVLREELGLTGAKEACAGGECGFCTVLIDNVPRYACLTLAVEAQGTQITTVEGLMKGEELGPTQKAFVEEDAMQCGYCTPGQIMAAEGLLRANPKPSADEILKGMSGTLCRCASYPTIFKAVSRAAGK